MSYLQVALAAAGIATTSIYNPYRDQSARASTAETRSSANDQLSANPTCEDSEKPGRRRKRDNRPPCIKGTAFSRTFAPCRACILVRKSAMPSIRPYSWALVDVQNAPENSSSSGPLSFPDGRSLTTAVN